MVYFSVRMTIYRLTHRCPHLGNEQPSKYHCSLWNCDEIQSVGLVDMSTVAHVEESIKVTFCPYFMNRFLLILNWNHNLSLNLNKVLLLPKSYHRLDANPGFWCESPALCVSLRELQKTCTWISSRSSMILCWKMNNWEWMDEIKETEEWV